MSDDESRPAEEATEDAQDAAPPSAAVRDAGTSSAATPVPGSTDDVVTAKPPDTASHASLVAMPVTALIVPAPVVRTSSHSEHARDGHGDEEHFAHTTPFPLLLGVLGALVILTVLTVAVTSVDLGGQGNFIVAMVIATIKAALVMGYFMHLVWDSKFNVIAFLSSFLFVLLFLSMTILDRGEYQSVVTQFEGDQIHQQKK